MSEYLDKEAFKKSVEERYCEPCKTEGKDHNGCLCRACWVDDMLDEVECSQSADVATVVHGNWIPFYESEISGFNPEFAGHDPISGYKCSGCGAEAILDCNDQFVLSKCCHNCGAKMGGGDK